MKFTNILLVLIGIAFLSIPVYAESGTVTVNQDTVYSNYSKSDDFTGAVPAGQTLGNFTQFAFNITNWKRINNFSFYGHSNLVYAHISEVSRFTIISGGSGGGTAWYSTPLDQVGFEFDAGNIYTNEYVNITFDTNILNNITNAVGHPLKYATTGIIFPNTTEPVALLNQSNGNMFVGFYTPDDFVLFSAGVNTFTSNSYVVTYPLAGKVLINITKTDKPTKDFITSQTLTYVAETTFNQGNFQFYGNYLDGLYLNVSLSGGGYNKVLINSSGIAAVPTPTPPGGGGSSSGQIYFDYTNATPGAVYGINASITNANFSSFDTYYIDVFDPTDIEITGFPASFGTQTYSTGRFYYFNKFGTYTANLSYCSYLNPLCPSVFSPTKLDTATLTVNQIVYSYNISTDKPNYQQGDIIYINATNPGLTNTYVTATGTTGIITELAWNAQVDPNSIRVIVGTIPNTLPLGTYFVSLAGSQGYNPILAQARFNITANTPDNVLGLGWNDYLYTIGGTGILTYKSNMNQSQVTIYKQGNSNEGLVAVKTFFAPAGNITGNYSQVFNSPGNWYAYIVDTINTSNFKWANTSVLNPNPSDPNAQGFCKSKESYVCWDKSEYYQGDAYIVNYKLVVPSVITYYPTIKIYDPSDNVVKTVKLNYSIWNNTITGAISGKFSTSAKTGIWFVKAEKINQVTGEDNGEITNSAASVIGRNVTAGTTPPSGDIAVNGAGNNLRILMSQPFFWGLIILALILYGIRNTQVVKEVAIFIIFVEDVVGLFSPYTLFILIGLIIFAAISFTSGKKIVTGE